MRLPALCVCWQSLALASTAVRDRCVRVAVDSYAVRMLVVPWVRIDYVMGGCYRGAVDSHVTLGADRIAELFGQRASFYVPAAQVRKPCSPPCVPTTCLPGTQETRAP